MMSGFRLKNKGQHIDISKPIKFSFDGKEYQGYEGDTLASAMLANGEMVLARSFKYHRPREYTQPDLKNQMRVQK